MPIFIATDHAGFAHKNAVRDWLRREGFAVHDCGSDVYDETDDYPDFIAEAAAHVALKPQTHRAIIFGGSGQGEAIVANRFTNVRATVYYGGPREIITLSREHNDANVLAIGARFVSPEDAMSVIWEWLHTDFSGEERHVRRIHKINRVTRELR